MMKRELLASGAGLLALAGCAASGDVTTSSVEKVILQSQFVLPLVDVLAAGLAVAVPATAPVIATVAPYLDSAFAALNLLSSTMPVADAQPIVGRIGGYVDLAIGAIKAAVATAAVSNERLGPLLPKIDQASAVVKLLMAFANGVQQMPGAAPAAPMRIKRVG